MKSVSNRLTIDRFDTNLFCDYNNFNQFINFNWGKTFLNCVHYDG